MAFPSDTPVVIEEGAERGYLTMVPALVVRRAIAPAIFLCWICIRHEDS